MLRAWFILTEGYKADADPDDDVGDLTPVEVVVPLMWSAWLQALRLQLLWLAARVACNGSGSQLKTSLV